ncbi:D-glycerate dehydrogenase [Leucobacter allii]|uniref:D-glycerate dehydrogenase n=1 Tax=Leucobacter allii TaxID=2932247 RepID=A0ABY4FKQ6_9MICO|nr:D-glycerate dehydrogenase [Leucobacter allii]UOQ56850.1 D-glycerate dehydrogenase [Leucobacter allii]
METVFISSSIPEDLRERLARSYRVVDVPEGTSSGFEQYGEPAGWFMDGGTPVDAAVIAQLPSLRVVSNHGVGYDSVDLPAATSAQILVSNTPSVLDNAVAELTLGLILALGRRIVASDRYVRDGSWEREWPALSHDVHGTTLGVVGMGRIGRRLAELVAPLGITVLYHNRSPRPEIDESGLAEWAEWEDMLARADFVSLHTPLTQRTRGFFAAEDFALMKPSAYLINMARGAVVRTPDLVAALRDGTIAGAALDVFDEEPLPASSPLCGMENVILQPHNGSATEETRRAMVELGVRNLERGLRGERPETPLNWDDIYGG